MIKLSRSKLFLLANILSRAGPCSNYSSSDKFNIELITERENLLLGADLTFAKGKQTPL